MRGSLRTEKLIVAFEQSWEYVRHIQTVFWESFTALLTVIFAIVFLIYDKPTLVQLFGAALASVLALMGFLVCGRIIIVLREHFPTINRVRRELGLDDYPKLIPQRWKTHASYSSADFRLRRPELLYIVIAHQMYAVLFSCLVAFLVYVGSAFLGSGLGMSLTGATLVGSLLALEMRAWWIVYSRKNYEEREGREAEVIKSD